MLNLMLCMLGASLIATGSTKDETIGAVLLSAGLGGALRLSENQTKVKEG